MPGSDQKINYQVRPAKAIERRMLCDLIREIQLVRADNEMRYIGLGAKYFSDFVLFHNEFGITDMISIEAEVDRQIRYNFNKPLKCIQMRYGTTNEILPQLDNFQEKMNLVWLDYDDSFDQTMLLDVETICRNLEIGSMFFLSCNYSFRGATVSEKKAAFESSVGDFFDETIEHKNYTAKKLPIVIRTMINTQVEKTIAKRNRLNQTDIMYKQLLFLTYKDGAPMMTIGGIFVNKKLQDEIEKRNIKSRYKFISDDDTIFNIDIPRLTNAEIQLILKNLPISEQEYQENKEKFYGIQYDEICSFEKIYRYYPYYSEGTFNT